MVLLVLNPARLDSSKHDGAYSKLMSCRGMTWMQAWSCTQDGSRVAFLQAHCMNASRIHEMQIQKQACRPTILPAQHKQGSRYGVHLHLKYKSYGIAQHSRQLGGEGREKPSKPGRTWYKTSVASNFQNCSTKLYVEVKISAWSITSSYWQVSMHARYVQIGAKI